MLLALVYVAVCWALPYSQSWNVIENASYAVVSVSFGAVDLFLTRGFLARPLLLLVHWYREVVEPRDHEGPQDPIT